MIPFNRYQSISIDIILCHLQYSPLVSLSIFVCCHTSFLFSLSMLQFSALVLVSWLSIGMASTPVSHLPSACQSSVCASASSFAFQVRCIAKSLPAVSMECVQALLGMQVLEKMGNMSEEERMKEMEMERKANGEWYEEGKKHQRFGVKFDHVDEENSGFGKTFDHAAKEFKHVYEVPHSVREGEHVGTKQSFGVKFDHVDEENSGFGKTFDHAAKEFKHVYEVPHSVREGEHVGTKQSFGVKFDHVDEENSGFGKTFDHAAKEFKHLDEVHNDAGKSSNHAEVHHNFGNEFAHAAKKYEHFDKQFEHEFNAHVKTHNEAIAHQVHITKHGSNARHPYYGRKHHRFGMRHHHANKHYDTAGAIQKPHRLLAVEIDAVESVHPAVQSQSNAASHFETKPFMPLPVGSKPLESQSNADSVNLQGVSMKQTK